MTGFRDHLQRIIAQPPRSTEDILALVLPVFRATHALHGRGLVAPLVRFDGVVWNDRNFDLAGTDEISPQFQWSAVEQVEAALDGAIEVVAPSTEMVVCGDQEVIERPVFVTEFRAWEACRGHHDAAADIYLLGLLLASVSLSMDLSDEQALRRFAAHRHNLFELRPDLHPVLARAIRLMAEPYRRRRADDLGKLISSLENYRDGRLELEFELDRIEGFHAKDLQTKEQIILSKLQQRLFDASRRNRLLHFRATGGTINLTLASTPLTDDLTQVPAERIIVWNDDFQHRIASGNALRLNSVLNFVEALYLPSSLERVRAESRRDMTEYGFAQLRLAACFLSWTNLKEQPAERFESPFVLVPVELNKEKGVTDAYVLRATADEAEVNPALRRVFQQLYGIELPETIDLSVASLRSLYDFLRDRVQQSQPAVQVELVEKPIVEDLQKMARRRLDQYRRRAGIDEAGTEAPDDSSASPSSPLESTSSAAPNEPSPTVPVDVDLAPDHSASQPHENAATSADANVPEVGNTTTTTVTESPEAATQARFRLKQAHADNPFIWTFDLCNVTLANFRYHKMSLVRDYDALIGEQRMSDAFDEVFRLSPRAPTPSTPGLKLDHRFDVMSSDPTQAAAVARARTGETYIIQGPPGTGKSQTISNLIADYAARGCRVLFVCEKRAAIDVVYSRLSQRGLADLCCLIHDSQADKKAFVLELKRTYEQYLADSKTKSNRDRATKNLISAIGPLVELERILQTAIGSHGLTIRKLLIRLITLRQHIDDLPAELSLRATYEHWLKAEDILQKLDHAIHDVQADGILAHHPLRLIVSSGTPGSQRTQQIASLAGNLRAVIQQLVEVLQSTQAPDEVLQHPSHTAAVLAFLVRLQPLAAKGASQQLLADSSSARELQQACQEMADAQHAVDEAKKGTEHWKTKLSPDETRNAIQWLNKLEADIFRWLKPRWWRLRKAILSNYDFSAHKIEPSWGQVLEQLNAEHVAAEKLGQLERQLAKRFLFDGEFSTWYRRVTELRQEWQSLPHQARQWIEKLIRNTAAQQLTALSEAAALYRTQVTTARGTFDDFEHYRLVDLESELVRLEQTLPTLTAFEPVLHLLTQLPTELAEFVRRQPVTLPVAEAAVARNSLENIYREYPELRRWDAELRAEAVNKIQSAHLKWLEHNSLAVRGAVRDRFVERVQLSSAPSSQLDNDQKEWKKSYSQGRRDLEREFGKTMRFRSIRDLIGSATGEVIRDMKPVWLMSPLSVADSLPLDPRQFDVVIFDEASQITLEEAVPTLCRAPQAIIVGDEMQLPPTSFFARRDEDELEVAWDEDGERQAYDLASESLLNHGARHLPSTMLGWHYRSRNELLIAFSNAAFYGRRLLTVPEEQLITLPRPALRNDSSFEGQLAADAALERPISFHRLLHGIYDKRRNRTEADYIAKMVHSLLARDTGLTIGIIAFSEAQQDEIEQSLQRLASKDPEFRERLDAEFERMEDNQFVGLLVKNLENIQGDERDLVILSVCYGPDPTGKLRMHFGPINVSGGEKRLNVAFSRAKQHMVVVSSIDGDQITNDYNAGARCLKNYLRYAAAVSTGAGETVEGILNELMPLKAAENHLEDGNESPAAAQLAEALRQHGWHVDANVGHSQFQCDLAVRGVEDTSYRLAILFDHEILPPHSTPETVDEHSLVLEKNVLRPRLLESFGWRVEHVLLREWRDDPQRAVHRVLQRLGTNAEPAS